MDTTTNVENQKKKEEIILVGGVTIPTSETIVIPPEGAINKNLLSKEDIEKGLPTLVIKAENNKEKEITEEEYVQ